MHLRLVTLCAAAVLAASAGASDSPLQAADEFLEAWSRGDVAHAVAAWDPARAAHFRAVFQRETELSCVRVIDASRRLSRITPATAAVEVDAGIVRVSAVTGRAQLEQEHHVIELRAVAGGWKVIGFRRREEVLADALIGLSAEERTARLAANPALVTPRLAIALSRCAILLSSRQRHDEAQAILALAERIADDTGSDAARSAMLAALSVEQRRNALAGDPRPILFGEEAESLAFLSGDPDAVGRARIRLARALEPVDGPRAESLLLEVLDSAGEIFDTATLATAASQLAWTYGDRLEQARGFRFALLASQYAELSGDPSARLNAAMNLAGSYLASGDFELAQLHYERAVAVGGESNAIAAQVFSLSNLAGIAADAEPGREPEVLGRALALASCAGDPGDASAVPLLTMRASLATSRGELAAARRALDAANALLSRTVIDERYHAAALAVEAELLLAEGKPEESLVLLEGAEAVVAARPEWESERSWSGPRARALFMLGRREGAIASLRSGIDALEESRASLPFDTRARQSFFRRSDLHDQLVDLLVEAGRGEEALEVADQSTARTLQDFVRSPDSRRGPASPEIERAERAVVDLNRVILAARPHDPTLEGHRQQLTSARLQLDELRMRTVAEHDSPSAHTAPTPIDLRRIDPRSAILRYVVTHDHTVVFVVRNGPHGPRVVTQRIAVTERDLDQRVKAMVASIDSRDAGYRELARALHALLIEPVARELQGIDRLAIVADGSLWELPFQTLVDRSGQDLLARFEIGYAPSVAWSLRDAGPSRRPTSILALGDPEVGAVGQATARALVPGRTLGHLPDAAVEARQAARLYPRSRVLTGRAADEAAVKGGASRFDVVHLATHALIDETQPLYSSLVLATHDAGDDGLLEARELLSLDLGAELFVLSACNTAGGRTYGGEGVVGLAWALLSNGVPHVVVSQWNADSRATRRLMVSFHRFFVAGDAPAAALRKAQLELRRDVRYEDPLYWAPFIVLGTARLGTARDVSFRPEPRPVLRRSQVSSAGTTRRRAGSVPP